MVEVLQILSAEEALQPPAVEVNPAYAYENHETPLGQTPVFSGEETDKVLRALPPQIVALYAAQRAEQQSGVQPTAMYEDSPYAGMAPVRYASPAVRRHIGAQVVGAFTALLEKRRAAND